MGILRFFIEENNFNEKDVTYPEYLEFFHELISRDFGLLLSEEENREIGGYIFDKIKNDGRLLILNILTRLKEKREFRG